MQRTSRPQPGPVAHRWLRRAALAWGGWLVLSTVLLNQPLIDDWINRKPVKFQVTWDVAVSLVPGHVMAWGIDLQGQSRGTAFGAHVRRGSAWFVPWALGRKEIALVGIRASGVAIKLRKGSVTLPPSPARERPWTLQLPGIRFRDLWSVKFGPSLELAGRGSGAVDVRKVLSGGELELGGGQLAWEDLHLHASGLSVVQGGRLDATLSLAPLVTSKASAVEKLRALSMDVTLEAVLVPLSLDGKGVHMGRQPDARGQVSAYVSVVDGVLGDHTKLSLKQPVHVEFEGVRDDRDLDLDLAIRDGRLVLDANLPQGKQASTTLEAHLQLPLPSAAQLQDARAGRSKQSLPRFLLSQTSGTVDLSLRFRSLVAIKPWLAKWNGLQADGDGWMHAAVRIEQGRLMEGTAVRFEDVQLTATAMAHGLEARIDGPLVRVDKASGRHRLQLQQVKLFGPGKLLLLQDAGAELDLVPHSSREDLLRLPGLALNIQDAAIPDIAVFNAYLPPGAVELGKGAAKLSLQLALDAEEENASGSFGLRAPAVLVRMADMRLQGELQVDSTLRDADLARKTLDLTGTQVSLRKVRFDGPKGDPVTGWSMTARVEKAHAEIGVPLRVQGAGTVAMSDLRLLLGIYAQIGDYPLWILRLADAGQVSAKGNFNLGDGQFKLTGVHARNERFEVDASLLLGKKDKQGALLVSWGPLAVAVELGGTGSKMHLKGAREWYLQHSR